MHRFLRYLFISMLLVVLPLRGWAGNTMAIDMVMNKAANAPGISALHEKAAWVAGQMSVASSLPADCAMHSQAPTDAAFGNAATHGNSCETCELCLAVTSLAQVQWTASQALQNSSPRTFDVRFSSAVKTSVLKPPIS